MFCEKCGKPLKDGAKFCAFCGQEVLPDDDFAQNQDAQANTNQSYNQGMQSNLNQSYNQNSQQNLNQPYYQGMQSNSASKSKIKMSQQFNGGQNQQFQQQNRQLNEEQAYHQQVMKNQYPQTNASQNGYQQSPQDDDSKKKKGILITCIIVGVVLIAALITAVILVLGNKDTKKTYAEYLADGQKYLEALNYEQAETELLDAIDIDPKQKDAYILLAQVYSKSERIDKARDILEKALKNADLDEDGQKEIQGYIDDIDNGNSMNISKGNGNNVSDAVDTIQRPNLIGNTQDTVDGELTASVPAYTVNSDLSNVTNREQFYIESGSRIEQLLAQNMFYVSEGYSKEFYETYETNRYSLTPNFVTVDSMMHTYHLYFSYLMKKTERDYLSSEVASMSQAMFDASVAQYNALKGSEWEDAALRNVAFFAIGANLQNVNVSVPSEASSIVSAEINKIMNASGIDTSAITNEMLDYSQFKSRGYYEGNEQLEQYFRAMMWYGQVGFVQKEEDLDRSALLMVLAMNSSAYDQWEAVYVVTSFFAGASDDLSYYEYLPAIEKAYGSLPQTADLIGNADSWNTFRSLIASMNAPKINSLPTMDDNDTSTSSVEENKGFRFMGQRFTIDEAIFQQLIYENVQPNSTGAKRMLPDTLDVAAALGSNEAFSILDSQGDTDYANYTQNMQQLQTGLASADDTLWKASLYSNWLYTLTPLLEEKGEGYPSFMQNSEWAKKNLESFAGSYAELKHDTILYAKQVMAEMGGGELPQWDDRGYVEPEPKVWARFADLSAQTAAGLKSYNLLSADDETNLKRLEQMANQFLTITKKELTNELPTDEEFDLIRNYGGNLEHFWLEAYKEEGDNVSSADFPAAIIADIATDPNGSCLEVGTGNPSRIYVIVPIDGELHICQGAVYSFYQFEQPLSNRLTDSTWRQMMGIALTDDGAYSTNSAIEQPAWTQSYRYKYGD